MQVDYIFGATRIGEGVKLTGINATEVDLHIVTGPDILGRLARISICRRPDKNVRMGLGHLVGYLVHKRQQGPHVRSFTLIDSRTFLALAVVAEPIVLADRDIPGLRSVFNLIPHRLDHDIEHLRIGQTQLALPFNLPLTADQGVIFRVVFPIRV